MRIIALLVYLSPFWLFPKGTWILVLCALAGALFPLAMDFLGRRVIAMIVPSRY